MEKTTLNLILSTIILATCVFYPNTIKAQTVKNWHIAGSKPESYKIGISHDKERNSNVAYLKSKESKIDGFGTIMQSFQPTDFLGKKVKLTGYIKTIDVKRWTGMWMRVDGPIKGQSLSFDNMGDRPIKGSTPWKKYEIILDVPKSATNISYGVLTDGTGDALIDNFNFEIISDDETSTGRVKLEKPTNTNFEESN
ncbi:hypothetical protein ABI125_01170 [Tamlana crocina]|uniref:Uncharacterized protein n=1 Tax=Tamlana crocina TaxID=393006 RepID=A0ABX1DA20_9FLAO|nr:hypothetical protein [Tamlana crocina]NJX14001.1 hypothetical protein [Tamlana crocina]